MIPLTIAANILRVVIPDNMKNQAPDLLKAIWRSEFAASSEFVVELTETVKEFVVQARVASNILVYQ